MKFNFFNNQNQTSAPVEHPTPPEIYRGMQIYESESDRFCSFDDDYFWGEEYAPTDVRQKTFVTVRDPKISPLTFLGFFLGALSVLLLTGGIIFFSSFSRSGGIFRKVTVPSFIGLSENEALALLSENKASFDYSVEYRENPNVPEGTVISQIPNQNTERKLYGIGNKISIKLTVSKASEALTLPDLTNQKAREVALELRNAGINVKTDEVYSDKIGVGKIVSTSLPIGSKIKKNDSLILTVSKGKYINLLPVPKLIGMSEATAEAILSRHGFNLGNVSYESSNLPIGTVISQNVDPDTTLREGSKISLTVSCGKQ